ncbi:Zinc finger protein PLAGL2 [Hypsizygus marmoreus]|uniref:Zinc finger protein PLAGL2 n=1 Tax=Hypsizygus marmoreus TaxID=39966 RepID=A0A369JGC9_HYPMA|nr:Zinc finger protein PLAGL2 [Hypsizygus marmoreus]
MQTQHYAPSVQQDLYHTQAMYLAQGPSTSSHFLSTGGLDHAGFSRGSSLTYPHQEYRYFPDRGGEPPRLPESACSSLAHLGSSQCATGMAIPGANFAVSGSEVFHPEGIADYQVQQRWRWPETLHGVPHLAAAAPAPPAPPQVPQISQQFGYTATIKSAMLHDQMGRHPPPPPSPAVVRSPTAQLPTPASMAVLLNPHARSERGEAQSSLYHGTQPQMHGANPRAAHMPAAHPAAPPFPPPSAAAVSQLCPVEPTREPGADSLSREKKHACTMCHKRFDRPSTLRKHLLVHTGEKAFVCDTCGRRFGVASNLNRHVKRCILKPVNAAVTSNKQPTSISDTSNSQPHPPSPTTSNAHSSGSSEQANSPGHQSTSAPSPTRSNNHNMQPQPKTPTAQKRRRRAPSPSRWIPPSLLTFNLSPPESKKSTPVPLPPVRRNLPKEERDSWDENVASSPYHPRGWKNVLPGPGLGLGLGFGGKDVRNLNLGGNGGFMLGRVLVF